MLELSKQI